MSNPDQSPMHAELWKIVQRINRSCIAVDLDALRELVHEDMIIVPPGFGSRVQGRDRYIASVKEFASRGKVVSYKEIEPVVDIFSNTAVVTFKYETVWESESEKFTDSGHDLMVFIQKDDSWLMVWRTLLPEMS